MVIINAKIVLLDRVIENGYVEVENGIIKSINEGKYRGSAYVFDAENNILMPGFIDIHTHGTNGIDFMNAGSLEEYKIVEDAFYKEGVTSFLATTLTSDNKSLMEVCETVAKVKKLIPSLLGIHLEGPYISKKYKGAQNEMFIRNPNIDELNNFINSSKNNIRNITIAPELDDVLKFIEYASNKDITISCGHSNASYEEVLKAMEYGLTNITHTTNGMNKNEGIVELVKDHKLYSEFICDGLHVSEDTIKDYYKIIGPDYFVLVTDSLSVKNTNSNCFKLFGINCVKDENGCYMKNGKLAGSILTMERAVKNMKQWCDCSLIDLAKISSKNAAKSLHIENLGEIKVGNIADLVLLNNNLDVMTVFKNGIQK